MGSRKGLQQFSYDGQTPLEVRFRTRGVVVGSAPELSK
jgi:hypothetical protein